jgi:CRP-like cAMP-binding protein
VTYGWPSLKGIAMQFRNLLLRALFQHGADGLMPLLREIHLERGDLTAEEESIPATVVFPGTAVLSATKLMSDGSAVEVATCGYEGASSILSCLSRSQSTMQIFTQIAGSAITVPAIALSDLAYRDPVIMKTLLRSVVITADQAEQSVACLALHEVLQRMARWILETQDRTSSNNFPLTQEYLGVMLGVQRTTVNGAAITLKRQGLITYTRGSVTVLDREGLQRFACECYGAVARRWQGDPLSLH